MSPTTVSGIESGRISRPHFGTIKKLAGALGVDPRESLSPQGSGERARPVPFSLGWATSSREAEFEKGLEEATLDSLRVLSRELDEEQERLRRLYGEARDAEQRRLVKGRIRDVAAQQGSVETSIAITPTSNLLSESKTSASSADHTPGGRGLFTPSTGNTVRIKLRPREVLVRVSSRRRKVSANREGVRAWPTA